MFRKIPSEKRLKMVHYGETFEGRTLDVYYLRPYVKHNERLPSKMHPDRPAIWLEAGFEGANLVGVQIALAVMTYLEKYCPDEELRHCDNDYYIVPDVNIDGLFEADSLFDAGAQETWNKTKEQFSVSAEEECTGVYLLNNFAHGAFEEGSQNECSKDYRGPYPMSAKETAYQRAVKSQTSPVLSVTISKLGSKITAPYAHTKMAHPDKERYQALMNVFTSRTSHFTSGFYADEHGEDFGHPLDYNDHEYNGNSFNVAIEEGDVNPNNRYEHSNESVKRMIKDFAEGFFHLVDYVVDNDYDTSKN